MRKSFSVIILVVWQITCYAQEHVSGKILSVSGQALYGVSVSVKGTNVKTSTNMNGDFNIQPVKETDTLVFSAIGYKSLMITFPFKNGASYYLNDDVEELEEVVISTGYYSIPKERATGSFSFVKNELIESNVSTDILSRLEGVTSSLVFDTRNVNSMKTFDRRELRIRGLSTMHADASPLVVVDNFPYEGDITNINPNDVQNVTILKDAAAASIWGAKAGNGVIVITTKKGNYGQRPKITFNSSINLGSKPDLHYNPNFLKSSSFIEFEKLMFDRGAYIENDATPLSPVVELLTSSKNGLIGEVEMEHRIGEFQKIDVRNEALNYLYRNRVDQQNFLNISGGSNNLQYYTSIGYDRNISNINGHNNNRITLNSLNSYQLNDRLEFSFGLSYILNRNTRNGFEMDDLRPANKTIYPYARLADDQGIPLAIVKDYRIGYTENSSDAGLLDWQYRPLEELSLSNQKEEKKESRLNFGVKFNLLEGLQMDVKYQYQDLSGNHRGLQSKDSYSVRNLVNRFTQSDGTMIIPHAEILNLSFNRQASHYGRAQVNYNRSWREGRSQLSGIAGAEIRQVRTESNGYGVYGFNDDVYTFQSQFDFTRRYSVLPRGTSLIPSLSRSFLGTLDRYISYFSNLSYIYGNKYILSASLRKDASNLFGVNSNQKGIPLWSIGGNWILSEEPFFDIDYFSYLKLRLTYGYSGNVDKTVSAFTTATFLRDAVTDLRYALVRTPGNPELRWEKVGNLNLGFDFETSNRRLNGSVEYYIKDSKDLIGNFPIDPTTGAFSGRNYYQRLNYANLKTKGFDIDISTINIDRIFKWRSAFLLGYVKDKVTNFEPQTNYINNYVGAFPPPELGRPLNKIYSYPWYGLDPLTGDPLISIDNVYSNDYSTYLQNLQPEDLIYHGSTIPEYFGSIRNTLEYQDFSLSANITWKGGYYFRRSSIEYDRLINNWEGHHDFDNRWKQAGDELLTNVPSFPMTNNSDRDILYNLSELTVEKGDHLRLQDIYLAYNFRKSWMKNVNKIQLYGYVRNLGVIWKANKKNLDPDFPSANVLPPKNIALGVRIDL